MVIGIISDTHGLLREDVKKSLKSCNLIIHAGDIGKYHVIDELNKICKTEFVKGNCDKNMDGNIIKEERIINIRGTKIYLIHDISKLKIDLHKENIDIVVYGHSHKNNIYEKDGILYINPGSVGPRRFKLPITMAKLIIEDNYMDYEEKEIYKFNNYEVEIINIIS